jgi:perosamine synthetase
MQKKIFESFEQEFAAYIGTKYAIGTSMGRTALFVALKAIDLRENDEVIMPAYICEIVPNSVKKLNGVPVLVDINLENYHILQSHLQSLINSKTKAIIIDHIFGYPEDVDAIKDIIKKSGIKIFLIEDAAHALGAEYNNQKVGSLGDIAIFSFTKNIINIGGGAITTNDLDLAKKIKKIVNKSKQLPILTKIFFGAFSILDSNRINPTISKKFITFIEIVAHKTNFASKEYTKSMKIPEEFAISTLQIMLAKFQIKRLNSLNAHRNANQKILDNALNNCKKIKVLKRADHTFNVCTWYVIQTDNEFIKQKLVNMRNITKFQMSYFWDYNQILKECNDQNQKNYPNTIKAVGSTFVCKMNPKMREKSMNDIARKLQEICCVGF